MKERFAGRRLAEGDAMNEHSVFLIDPSRLFREGLVRILSGLSFGAVHEAFSVDDALPLIASLQPSLVLVDAHDAGAAFATRIGQIRAAAPRMRIVVLTDTIHIARLAEALSAGADGYLSKSMSADALQQSLRLVLLGEKVFPTDLANLLTKSQIVPENGLGQADHANGLSAREIQILGCLLNGAANKQIAHDLKISDATVKVHLKAILKKIGARNRTQAAIWALSHGMKEGGPHHGSIAARSRSVHGAVRSGIASAPLETPNGR
jgi:two-component system, NarL family, nitrate/nitrite response regulator NarL